MDQVVPGDCGAEVVISILRCFFRGTHREAKRHPLGGWRCGECGFAGEDLEAMGYGREAGYVNTVRKVFSRQNNGEITRTSAFEQSKRGMW